jgi:hypothetical protein
MHICLYESRNLSLVWYEPLYMMYVWMYACMYSDRMRALKLHVTHMYVYMFMYVCTSMHACMHTHTHTYTYTYTCVCVFVCMNIFNCVRIYVTWMHVYACMQEFVYITQCDGTVMCMRVPKKRVPKITTHAWISCHEKLQAHGTRDF